ncbi:formylglycine-generating enzyme family protein [Denitromonas ohlonensis]|nr:formylglycine-generating enzyme family protein [Denitromonas ohlonensis]
MHLSVQNRAKSRVLLIPLTLCAVFTSACTSFNPAEDPKITAEAQKKKTELLESVSTSWIQRRSREYGEWQSSNSDNENQLKSIIDKAPEQATKKDRSIDANDRVTFFYLSTTEIWDKHFAPKMVAIPSGEFSIGGRDKKADSNEKPLKRIAIKKPFLVSKNPITLGEFAYFVKKTGYKSDSGIKGCLFNSIFWQLGSEHGWAFPGYEQSFDHPVVCINKHDALAYADWLRKVTNKNYRLLTEAEYEWAASGGKDGAYHWGDTYEEGKGNCSVRGTEGVKPVGSYESNSFGLFDMAGGPTTYVQDCFLDNYEALPADGSAVKQGKPAGGLVDKLAETYKPDECLSSVRGGSWWVVGLFQNTYHGCENSLRISKRSFGNINSRQFNRGLRLARDIP